MVKTLTTYSVGPEQSCGADGVPLRPLACDCCGGIIGHVSAAWELTGLNADFVTAVWPGLEEAVARHACGGPTP